MCSLHLCFQVSAEVPACAGCPPCPLHSTYPGSVLLSPHRSGLPACRGRADCSSQERVSLPFSSWPLVTSLDCLFLFLLLHFPKVFLSSYRWLLIFSLSHKSVPSVTVKTLHLPKKPPSFPLYIRRQQASSGCSMR